MPSYANMIIDRDAFELWLAADTRRMTSRLRACLRASGDEAAQFTEEAAEACQPSVLAMLSHEMSDAFRRWEQADRREPCPDEAWLLHCVHVLYGGEPVDPSRPDPDLDAIPETSAHQGWQRDDHPSLTVAERQGARL